ncbi:endonuclease [Rossellomorea aquimaris]|uniref:endonuclease n=1 Tax=Rossellomorea aquimaris TaxID=189382 RepID=UPI001E602A9D|nr:endonuclease [Rossellomorea aquimaris]
MSQPDTVQKIQPNVEKNLENLSVKEAMENQDGRMVRVSGYIVGQPISESNIVMDNYSNNFSLALADLNTEQDPKHILYVQIPSEFRHRFGLQSNPSLKGKKLSLTGNLSLYFSHPGLKSPSEISFINEDDKNEDPKNPPELEVYYASASGKKGDDLKKALHEIIDNHTELSYKDVWDALRKTDEDPNNPNNVILLYSGRSQSKYSNGGDIDDWNREHVWAKSHGDFGTAKGPGTDLHHIRPTDVTINSSRSNLDFDSGGLPHPEAPLTFYDQDSWEPRDSIKGDVARMLFYMSVRYEGDNEEIDLELNDIVENNHNPFHGKQSVLLQWHNEDPVDDSERRRNQIIYEQYQGNRNPFIDHPEWINEMW